ncbi:dnd system-associated protein 3 [Levilactobacillus namurensis DSM 19117]|uniref:Dnd system-associated protein 3 n=1 Tax=Levilactobacillus namurensis DSM 19117 TaxID=1423773 RepID=A0A0R1JYY4_9LACO|nr:DNA phosphorothioation-dependent restriction protein DptF [Levilactobacillus namurensis]KRK76304.1 dnd system-associated protein 3 [Levilactobacillus namurensis DSM 19117]GEO73675.1 hypothetical protein LNA02_03730 [Levilactobacillus namurensis]
MNFCPNCGAKLISGSNFCSNCGANLNKYRNGENTKPDSGLVSQNQSVIAPQEPSLTDDEIKMEKDMAKSHSVEQKQYSEKSMSVNSENDKSTQSTLDTESVDQEELSSGSTEKSNDDFAESDFEQDSEVDEKRKMNVQPAPPKNSPKIITHLVVKQERKTASDNDQLNRQLRIQLNALYIQLTLTFGTPEGSGSLATKFSRIKLRISRKIEGYDLDELANRVEPLCQEGHIATQSEVDFVQMLISKYQNYGRASELEKNLNYLSGQSSSAIVDAKHLNQIQEYMHVDRGTLEKDLLTMIQNLSDQHGKLIFLVGNVGDGKSHLIGYLMQKNPDIFKKNHVQVHYDATESFDPHKTAMETLLETLDPFSDDKIDTNRVNLIVAINMGILVNFMRQAKKNGNFGKMLAFLNESGITTSATDKTRLVDTQFGLLSFRDYPLFEIDETGTKSQFYDDIFTKIATRSEENPFYRAYKEDRAAYVMRLTHHNYELFMNSKVRDTLKFLLIKIQVESKVIISTRALLELIHDILVPTRLEENDVITYRYSLPYLLFGGSGDSAIIKKINEFDPQKFQNQQVEELMTRVYNSHKNLQKLTEMFLGSQGAKQIEWLWDYINVDKASFEEKVGLLLRMKYLLDRQNSIFDDRLYHQYLNQLASASTGDAHNPNNRELYKKAKQFIYDWNGSPQSNYIFTFINERKKFGVAVPFNLVFKGITEHDFNVVFELKNADANQSYPLVIDYDLFVLINRVNQGYLLKADDRHQFVNVATFIENITKSKQTNKETLIGNIETNKFYRLTDDGMGVEMGEV